MADAEITRLLDEIEQRHRNIERLLERLLDQMSRGTPSDRPRRGADHFATSGGISTMYYDRPVDVLDG